MSITTEPDVSDRTIRHAEQLHDHILTEFDYTAAEVSIIVKSDGTIDGTIDADSSRPPSAVHETLDTFCSVDDT